MKNTTPVQSAALFICRLWFFLSWSSFIFYMFIVFFFCECVYMCLFWISPSSVMQYDGLWRNPHNAAMLLAIYLCQFGLDVFCYWRGVAYYLTDPFDPYPWDSSRFTKIRVFVIVQNIYVYVCVRALWCLRLPFKIYIFLPVSLLLIVFFSFCMFAASFHRILWLNTRTLWIKFALNKDSCTIEEGRRGSSISSVP